MKNILIVFILCSIANANAQNPNSDGVYTSSFGTVTLTTEYGSEFPGGYGITYGDYKDKGTITGAIGGTPNHEELTGTFFNGADEGKFIFFPKNKDLFKNTFNSEITGFSGYWGYNSDNKYSSNAKDKWDGNRTQKGFQNIQNVTNVWSGKWETTDGAMYLNQVANRIVGTYKGVGTIKANYNPSTRILNGTFTNNNFNKTGYIEFYFEGNSFKGKWGWTQAMTEGNWDGTKHIKNNKELSKAIVFDENTTSTSSVTSTMQSLKSLVEVKNNVGTLKITLVKIERGNSAIKRLEDLYGFVGVEIYKVTENGKELLKSFANKSQYFFNNTEDAPFATNFLGICHFPNQPNYIREFQINATDWNNPNIRFEVRFWHHIKGKIYGPNRDYGKYSEVFDLSTIRVDKNNRIKVGKDYINGKNNDSILDLDFANSKAEFEITLKF